VKHFIWALDMFRVYSMETIFRAMMGKPVKQVFMTWVLDVLKAVTKALEEVVHK
jgi:hypothetical protein